MCVCACYNIYIFFKFPGRYIETCYSKNISNIVTSVKLEDFDFFSWMFVTVQDNLLWKQGILVHSYLESQSCLMQIDFLSLFKCRICHKQLITFILYSV